MYLAVSDLKDLVVDTDPAQMCEMRVNAPLVAIRSAPRLWPWSAAVQDCSAIAGPPPVSMPQMGNAFPSLDIGLSDCWVAFGVVRGNSVSSASDRAAGEQR